MTVFLQLALVVASQTLATQTLAPRPLDYWRAIAENGMALPEDESAYALIVELSGHLGSTDSVLRDDYGYGIPANWIRHQQLLSDEELLALADMWVSNLDVEVGELHRDSVLLRSFSALNLSMLVSYDNRHPFLDRGDFEMLLEGALMYAEKERDVRGWVDRLGWCHSAAHTADLLKSLGRSRHLQPEEQFLILVGISHRLRHTGGYVFVHGEDSRLAAAGFAILNRGDFDPQVFEEFVNSFDVTFRATPYKDGFNAPSHAAQQNSKNFLRALYVRLVRAKDPTPEQVNSRDLVLMALPKR